MIDSFLLQYLSEYHLSVLTFIGIFTILAISLDIVNGYTGQFSIGHAGFMAVGAYVSAYLTFFQQMNFILAMLIGGVAASILGFIIGLPTLRLKGDYLAIATLGFAEIIRVILLNIEATGGPRGFIGIHTASNFTIVLVVALISFILLYNFTRSSYGRVLTAIREDEIAAECLGISSTHYKVLAFVIAAAFAGVAGALYAHYLGFLHPNDFGLLRSIEVLLMIVLGGMGNLFGATLGAVVLSVLPETLRTPEGIVWTLAIVFIVGVLITYKAGKKSPVRYWITVVSVFLLLLFGLTAAKDVLVTKASQTRMVIYAILLIVMMIFRPQGLIGSVRLKLPFVRKKEKDEHSA